MDEKSVRYIPNLAAPNGEHVGHATQPSAAADPNLPEEFGQPCRLCGGTGWQLVQNAGTTRVKRCDCFRQNHSEQLIRLAEIPTLHGESEFSTYDTGSSHTLAAAKITVEKWAEQYPLNRVGLLVIGPSGVGKTHLIVAAIKVLARKGVRCLFCDYRELLKRIQNSYNPQSQTSELEILKPVFDAEVLVLDDLGAVKPTEWVWDAVSMVLNTRYNDKRTTLITSNIEDGPAKRFDTTALQSATRKDTLGDRIGERMRSRLFEMCRLVPVDGKDYREKFRRGSARK